MSLIQLATYEDRYKEQIIQLILDIQINEFKVPITRHDQPDLERITEFYQKDNGNFWVALKDECVIGTVGLIDIGHAQAALRKMFVAKEYRGKEMGVSRLLLETVLAWGKQKAIKEVFLGTVAILYAAQRFYAKNGFAEITKNELPKHFPVMEVDTKFYVYRF